MIKMRYYLRNLEVSVVIFVLACTGGLFSAGFIVGRYHVFPYRWLEYATQSVRQVWNQKWNQLGIRPTEYLFPATTDGSGITRFEEDRAVAGLTLLTGFFDQKTEIRLTRLDGSVVNRWPALFFDFFPDPKHVRPNRVPKTNWNVAVHGGLVLPDGSIVFNFNYLGLVKLDRCGKVQWTLPRLTHHAVAPASGGGVWVPAARYVDKESRFPILRPTYVEDTIMKVSDDGKVLKEISLLDILFKNNLLGVINHTGVSGDLTHLNDVEELDPETAKAFPQFEAGDLLVSMRFQSMVMVVSPETLSVKWRVTGPWHGQHDPDFLPDGKISVFNNNDDGTETGTVFGGANIMEVDPKTGSVETVYGGSNKQHMSARERGKHQRLWVNGTRSNLLVTIPQEGRAVEVNNEGQTVWEFINRYDEESVALVTQADRFPEDYFTVRDWTCKAN